MTLSNIKKLNIYRIFASLNLIYPVYILFLLSKNLSMTEVMIINAVFTVGMVVFSIPAGIISDKYGRKLVLIIAGILFIFSHAAYYFGETFFQFLLIEILFSVTCGMWESSIDAFFYDSLKIEGHETRYKKYFGNYMAIAGVSLAVASVAGTQIADYLGDYSILWIFTAGFQTIGFLIILSLKEVKTGKTESKKYTHHLIEAYKYCRDHPKLGLVMLYSPIIGVVMYSGFLLYQPFFLQIKLPLVFFGVVFFLMSLSQAFGSKISHKIEKWLGEKKALAIVSLLPAVLFVVMAVSRYIWMAIIPILIYFTAGLKDILMNDYVNKYISSHNRATINSFRIFIFSLLSGIMLPIIGVLTDRYGLAVAFICNALILLSALVILIIAFYRNGKK